MKLMKSNPVFMNLGETIEMVCVCNKCDSVLGDVDIDCAKLHVIDMQSAIEFDIAIEADIFLNVFFFGFYLALPHINEATCWLQPP